MSNVKKITLEITGMTCGRCADRIRSTLKKERGVLKTTVSLKQGTALVRFKPSETTVENILGSKAFTEAFVTEASVGRTIIHRYNAKQLNAADRT